MSSLLVNIPAPKKNCGKQFDLKSFDRSKKQDHQTGLFRTCLC
jgi:hypothetical protein